MIFGGISNSGLPQHVLLGKNHGLNREFKDTLFQTDWVNINPLLSTTPVLFKNESFFFSCVSIRTYHKGSPLDNFRKEFKTLICSQCENILGTQLRPHRAQGWIWFGTTRPTRPLRWRLVQPLPFWSVPEFISRSSQHVSGSSATSPSKIDVITKENYSKGFRSPPLQIAWNITRTVTNHLSSDPKISRVVEMIYPHAFGMFLHVFYHHFVSIQPHPTVPVPVPGQERVLRSLAQCGKPFAMLLPISVLHVGGEPWEPSIQRGDLEWILSLLYNIN